MSLITSDIGKAIEILNKEDVVAIPTETVYGLAGNIYSEKAINKIFQLKKRPLFNPLIVHIKSLDSLKNIAVNVPDAAIKLANVFWPGPLTLILDKHDSVSDLITAGKKTVAVRIPNHPVALSILEKINFPLAAPSANPFGFISPTSAEHVAAYFKDSLEIVIDGGVCTRGIESTIIGFQNNEITLYRHGSITVEELEAVVGKINNGVINNETNPQAPGMLSKHYSPVTPSYLTDNVPESIKRFSGKKIGLLLFDKNIKDEKIKHQVVLSASADLKEAAANLYAALHILDKLNVDIIIAERLPDIGLGRTINDRLERATKI